MQDHGHEPLALALGGGGSKGSFEMGAWQAFRELGLVFDAVAGTSIGAINGAFMAMDAFDEALHMWKTLKMDQCLAFSEPYPLKSSDLMNLKNMHALAREMVTRHRLDTQPLRDLISRHINEDRVRSGSLRFGLMTVLFRSLTPQPRWIDEIPPNRLIDYLMASAGLLGLEPIHIDGQRFIDGGFAEPVPISMLRVQGFRNIVAVDLGAKAVLRPPLIDNLRLTYIHDREDLGGLFDLTPSILERNRRLGYLDTLKAFGRLEGEIYSLTTDAGRTLVRHYGRENLRGLEQAANAFGMDRLPVYSADSFIETLRQRRREAQREYEHRRNALRIDEKAKSAIVGQLKSLRLLPPMKLSFLLELTASARANGRTLNLPVHLFQNLDLAADALIALDGEPMEQPGSLH